jgi:hypothetical protein
MSLNADGKPKEEKSSGKFLVCPIHGRCEGKEIQMEENVDIVDKKTKEVTHTKKLSKGYKCPEDGCDTQRLEKDLD